MKMAATGREGGRMRNQWLWVPILTALAVVACGPASAAQGTLSSPPSGSGPSTASETTAPSPTEAPTASSVDSYGDVSSYVACEIVAPQEVADLIGGPLFRDLPQPPSPSCTYEVVAGPKDYVQFTAFIEPADWVQALIDNAPEMVGDPVPGLGDVAYLSHDETTDLYSLLIVVHDRFGLEISGDTSREWTLALGELFLSRMVGP